MLFRSFWAKIGSGVTPNVQVSFPDKDTDPTGGLCDPSSTGATGCYDHYNERLFFSTTWTQETIYFTKLVQDGWGNLAPAFDPTTLYSIQFNVAAGSTFDISIDDLAFITQ